MATLYSGAMIGGGAVPRVTAAPLRGWELSRFLLSFLITASIPWCVCVITPIKGRPWRRNASLPWWLVMSLEVLRCDARWLRNLDGDANFFLLFYSCFGFLCVYVSLHPLTHYDDNANVFYLFLSRGSGFYPSNSAVSYNGVVFTIMRVFKGLH